MYLLNFRKSWYLILNPWQFSRKKTFASPSKDWVGLRYTLVFLIITSINIAWIPWRTWLDFGWSCYLGGLTTANFSDYQPDRQVLGGVSPGSAPGQRPLRQHHPHHPGPPHPRPDDCRGQVRLHLPALQHGPRPQEGWVVRLWLDFYIIYCLLHVINVLRFNMHSSDELERKQDDKVSW